MNCLVPGCKNRAGTRSNFYCISHTIDLGLSFSEWSRAEQNERSSLFRTLPRGVPEDDWRARVVARAVLPRPTRLFCHEATTWRRVGCRPSDELSYEPPAEGLQDGLWPLEYRAALVDLKDSVDRLLPELDLMEELVIRLRCGIAGYVERQGVRIECCGEEHTLDELAAGLHFSRERIRQIENKALRKLRHPRLRRDLDQYVSRESYYEPEIPARDVTVEKITGRELSLSTKLLAEMKAIENPRPPSSTAWLVCWRGASSPKGAVLGRRVVEWAVDGEVACDSGRVIGTFARLPDAGGVRRMIAWTYEGLA